MQVFFHSFVKLALLALCFFCLFPISESWAYTLSDKFMCGYSPNYCDRIYACDMSVSLLSEGDTKHSCVDTVYAHLGWSSGDSVLDSANAKAECLDYFLSGGYLSTDSIFTGVVLTRSLNVRFPVSPSEEISTDVCGGSGPPDDPENPPNCNIDTFEIVRQALANKFPMDVLVAPPVFDGSTCPGFTIDGQTFQLCYLVDLARALKYAVLVGVIISSILQL